MSSAWGQVFEDKSCKTHSHRRHFQRRRKRLQLGSYLGGTTVTKNCPICCSNTKGIGPSSTTTVAAIVADAVNFANVSAALQRLIFSVVSSGVSYPLFKVWTCFCVTELWFCRVCPGQDNRLEENKKVE
jgi:hypothetical protein